MPEEEGAPNKIRFPHIQSEKHFLATSTTRRGAARRRLLAPTAKRSRRSRVRDSFDHTHAALVVAGLEDVDEEDVVAGEGREADESEDALAGEGLAGEDMR